MCYMDINVKKTIISGCIASVMMMSVGAAMAASMSPELKVKGQIATPSCEVSLGNQGVFDYGKIGNSMIKPSATTALESKSTIVKVNCEAETFLNFSVIDNRASSSSLASSTSFGLGNVNGTGKLGYYKLRLVSGTIDNAQTLVYSTNKGSLSFAAEQSVYADKNKVTGWAKSANVQASGKAFSSALVVEPVLASSKDMGGPVTDNVKLDGSATLNFSYGL